MGETIKHQFKDNFIAIVSLTIAIIALSYTTWREELTEKNRTLRLASFEILKNLGELQIVVNQSFYQSNSTLAIPFLGWGNIALISDMSELLPPPIPEATVELVKIWGKDWNKIKSEEESVARISNEIDKTRQVVLKTIKTLR